MFFFQAEDGIRDWSVTGVQTCALPIYFAALNFKDPKPAPSAKRWDSPEWASYFNFNLAAMDVSVDFVVRMGPELVEIGRASCRERVWFRWGSETVKRTQRNWWCWRTTM